MLKKTALTLAVLASAGVSAGTMGPICTPDNVTVPCAQPGWSLAVQALYLRPIYNGTRSLITSAGNIVATNDKWGWGFDLEGSYQFSTGNDLTLDWMHYDVDSNRGGNFIGATPIGAAPYTVGHTNKFDQVNLVFGQHIDFGMVKDARFYGGLQYVNIRNNHTNYYSPLPAVAASLGIGSIAFHDNADFNGLGPVLGIDYAYHLNPAFSITANTAASILYGSSRNDLGYAVGPTGLVPDATYLSKKSIVPGVEAKLGLNYGYTMTQGILNISGGYQIVNYFNALTLGPIGGVPTNSDFGLYGPYVGLSWVGNV